MNIKSIIAFAISAAVLAFSIHSGGKVSLFLDAHALLIVLGGTFAAGAIALQIDRLFLMFRIFIARVLKGNKVNYASIIEELMLIAEAYRSGSAEVEKLVEKSKDPFLKEAVGMLLEGVLEEERLIKVLKSRVNTIHQNQVEEVAKFKTVGKYPPAFGLMGTTLSMISLLQKLGQPGGQALIGPAMALGLVATFWGLVFSNLVFSPIAENLEEGTRELRTKNLIVVEGVKLIILKMNPVVLAEELNSFLIPSERIDRKKLGVNKSK
jgi:chemotaxis protein MotA